MPDNPDKQSKPTYGEVGYTGLNRQGGRITEEWFRKLQGPRGRKLYREMADNEPIAGAFLYGLNMFVLQAPWEVRTPRNLSEDNRAIEIAELFHGMLFDDIELPWNDVLTEILTEVVFGWSAMETVLKERQGPDAPFPHTSKFDDGLVGVRKLSPRAQEALDEWDYDEDGRLVGMKQQGEFGRSITIPRDKLLLFRTMSNKDSPEGRALPVDTLVPTPDGWTRMDELYPGDKIYDHRGKITYVSAVSQIWKQRPCYSIIFDDKSEITADENHLWSVTTAGDRTYIREPRVLSTWEMAKRLNSDKTDPFYAVSPPGYLDGVERSLLVDPYVLGYWLGDGTATGGDFTCDVEDLDNLCEAIEDGQYEVSRIRVPNNGSNKRRVGTKGLYRDLNSLGLIGDKRIPSEYLRASVEQRLRLLRGLMDSDGCTARYKNGTKAASYFCNTNETLIQQVAELVRSFGWKARVYFKEGRRQEKFGRMVDTKDSWRVYFRPDEIVHRLKRKVKNQDIDISPGHNLRRIRSITPVEAKNTVCIEVESPEHLFLVGDGMIPTHNSLLRTAVKPYLRKRNLEAIEAIGIERNLAGYPVMRIPGEILAPNATGDLASLRTKYEDMVRDIRVDEQHGLLLPSDTDENGNRIFDLDLLSAESRFTETSPVIQRYSREILQSVLADVVMIGHEQIGSFALASSKTELFIFGVASILDSIKAPFNNHLIPKLMDLNGLPRELTPELHYGDVENMDLQVFAEALEKLVGIGYAPEADDKIRRHVRQLFDLPEPSAGSEPAPPDNPEPDDVDDEQEDSDN